MELTIGTIIKLILGILVIAAVAYGLFRFFSNNMVGSFSDMGLNGSVKCLLALL